MTADRLTSLAEGTWHKGKYRPESEIAFCRRCGIERVTRGDRKPGLCMDCRGIERRIRPVPLIGGRMVRKGLVHVFVPTPVRMSAEDMAWAEREAVRASWRCKDWYQPTDRGSEAA